jgi:predicted ATP-grasp superfamily ATP-dependent carboligase
METRLEIKEHDPSKISKPNIVVGVPEAGLVGTI